MTRILLLSAALACGCVNVRPVGPMADLFPKPAKPTDPKDAPAGGPALLPAPPPPAPAVLVSPAEVTAETADDMARKLEAELDADRKAMDAMPRYSEVSVVGKK